MELGHRLSTQYIYRYKNSEDFPRVEKQLAKLDISGNYVIRDISTYSEDETISELNAVLAAERSKYYYDGDPLYFLNIFKIKGGSYVVIMSVTMELFYENERLVEVLCKALFDCDYQEAINWGKKPPDTASNAIDFWSERFSHVKSEEFPTAPRCKENVVFETFMAGKELSEKFAEFLDMGRNPYVLCQAVMGKLSTMLLNKDKVMINAVTTSRALPGAPVIFEKSDDPKEEYENLFEQNTYILKNSACTRDQLYKIIGNRFISRVLATSYYADENTFKTMLKDMVPGVLYNQPAIDTMGTPLTTFFRFFSGRLSIGFMYDEGSFGKVDVEKVNVIMCRIMSMYLGDGKTIYYPSAEEGRVAVDDGGRRLEEIKCKLLRKFKVTEGLDAEELRTFSREFGVMHKSDKQPIVLSDEEVGKLYFLCSGKVEVLGTGPGHCLNPIYIAKAGDIFGIESLTDNIKASATCIASTDDVIVLTIDASDFTSQCRKHPFMLKAILSEQSKKLRRLEKLWLTV